MAQVCLWKPGIELLHLRGQTRDVCRDHLRPLPPDSLSHSIDPAQASDDLVRTYSVLEPEKAVRQANLIDKRTSLPYSDYQ
jgi:hypothetical protein